MARAKNNLAGRIKRYSQVGGKAARLGAQVVGQKIGLAKDDRQKRAEALRAMLGQLKGPLMKVAQILSTIPDAVPEEYARELAQLQADAPSMGWPFVKRRMTAELGADWENKFRSFEHTAAAAASLGQVHRAIGEDGKALACKLQYPDMESVIEADLKQLKLLMGLFEKYDRAVSTEEVQKEIAARLREELDYGLEARHIRLYADILHDVDDVHVPAVVDGLSTDRLLTMHWLDGERLLHAARERTLADRNKIAINMFHAWYVPFYNYGIIHGDPHLGNYSIRPDNGINLFDFGCVRVFPAPLISSVIELYRALESNDLDRAVAAYEVWGFRKPSRKLIEVLNIWARFVYAPILENKTQPIEETNSGAYGRETARNVHAELRKLGGGVVVPRPFVFMDRAAIGLGSVFLHLKAEVNWYKLFHDMIAGYDEARLARQQAKALGKYHIPSA